MKVFATNKKAYHLYSIIDTIEVGVVLSGDEVKSIRLGHVSLNGAYAVVSDGVLSLLNCHVTRYTNSFKFTKGGAEDRTRILLAHRREIEKLKGQVMAKKMTLVPLKIYVTKKGYIKIQLGIAKHKNLIDRKQEMKERDLDREAKREMKSRE